MSNKRLRELFLLSPVQQIRHWAQLDPWESMKIENSTVVGVNSVLLDGDWNITRMPLFLKPCFGQPTAFARHGGVQPIFHPRFGTVKSRCMRCNAKEACENVANKRLRATPELKQAYVMFHMAGGSFGLKNPKDCPTAERQFNGLVSALRSHGGFKSCNDVAAIAELDAREEDAKRREAEKKRAARRKRIRKGDLDPDFLALMQRQAEQRAVSLILASTWEHMPPNISKIPESSATITADVWLVRECMRLRGEVINASSVARELNKLKPATYPPSKHNSLRQRVQFDLRRVDTLERLTPRNHTETVWPRFKISEALNELDRLTPYTP